MTHRSNIDCSNREVSGQPGDKYDRIRNFDLLKALYIAVTISPIALLTSTMVTSDRRCRVGLAQLGEVRGWCDANAVRELKSFDQGTSISKDEEGRSFTGCRRRSLPYYYRDGERRDK